QPQGRRPRAGRRPAGSSGRAGSVLRGGAYSRKRKRPALSARRDGAFEERRRFPRYRIDATIAVNDGTGRAIDLSANSVFFETARAFKPGDQVALTFPLESTGPGVSVTCTGSVVRTVPR